MKPPPFHYHRPAGLDEALAVLADVGHDGKVLAGGQSLVPLLNMRLAAPRHLIDINGIGSLAYVRRAGEGGSEVEVGALVSLQDGTQDPGVCANPACDAACDAPAGVSACEARCKDSPTVQICMADCASECHMFCGGQVPGRRYLDLAYAFSGVAANVCSDDASPALSRLSAVVGIPRQVLLRAPPSPPDVLVVRVERGGQTRECVAGAGYDIVSTPDGPAVRFTGTCALQPDDVWDLRYLTSR